METRRWRLGDGDVNDPLFSGRYAADPGFVFRIRAPATLFELSVVAMPCTFARANLPSCKPEESERLSGCESRVSVSQRENSAQ